MVNTDLLMQGGKLNLDNEEEEFDDD